MSLFARLVSCLVAARSSARLMPVLAVAGLGLLGACGSTPGGGGGGILYSGGAAGTVCDPATQNQGCLVEAGGYAVMQCTGTAWAKAASCASGEICVEAVVGGKIGASCKAPEVAADATAGGDSQNNTDSSAATDAAAAGDSTLVDVNIVGQDSTSAKDTTTGSDGTTGKDTTSGKDAVVQADINAKDDVCGNTLCGPQETEATCIADCGPVFTCVWDSCPTEKTACLNNATCKSYLLCSAACTNDSCQQECATTFKAAESFITDLDTCGTSAGCFGGSTGNGSCSGVCDSADDQGGCYCDTQCVEYEDCCPDYNQFCPAP